jgi:hypothetical protein
MKLGVGLALALLPRLQARLLQLQHDRQHDRHRAAVPDRRCPGQFETTYQSWSPEQWPQGLFGFH